MATVTIRIDDVFLDQIKTRAAKRGLSLNAAGKQILTLGWATWRDRGNTERKRATRASKTRFKASLTPGAVVLAPDGRKVTLTGRCLVNPKCWEGVLEDGGECILQPQQIRPVPAAGE